MTGAVIGSGPTAKTLSYSYDPNGIRRSQEITEVSGRTRIEYHVDPNQAYAQVLEEWSATAPTGPLPAEILDKTYVYGDDLISQTKLALTGNTTSVYHYDGLGTTRLLSAHKVDATGTPQAGHGAVTDRYAYTAFGETDPAGTSGDTSGNTANNYQYTGEQLDPNLGFYYLRARYMDPGAGRFLGMDPWGGALPDPLSAHRYLAVNLDPANRTDPSGLTANLAELMSARDASTTLALSSVRTATINTARVAANDALWTATSAAATTSVAPNTSILTALALSIAANETHRFLGVPIIVFGGEEYPQHALHIAEAQVGFGSNYFPISPALNRVPAWSRDWLDYTSECENRNGFVCDEYPFASSRQGGLLNYLGFGVSLRLLNPSESWRTGFFIKDFYNDATISADGLSPWSRFVALGIPGARSFYTDRKGNPHYTRYP